MLCDTVIAVHEQ